MSAEFRTCRFCREQATALLHYSTRCYAHHDCYLLRTDAERAEFARTKHNAHARERLEALHTWQLETYRALAAHECGAWGTLLTVLGSRTDRRGAQS